MWRRLQPAELLRDRRLKPAPHQSAYQNRDEVLSRSRRNRFVGRPPPKPVRAPFAPMTRRQGTTIGSGLAPFAVPTALTASGLPIRSAICEYERVSPYGIERSSLHTRS